MIRKGGQWKEMDHLSADVYINDKNEGGFQWPEKMK